MRLIDADALMAWLEECTDEWGWIVSQYSADWIWSMLDSAPTVGAVEVVRCKDCKHYGGITFGRTCRMFSGMNTRIEMSEDGFCSYGERRADGKEA